METNLEIANVLIRRGFAEYIRAIESAVEHKPQRTTTLKFHRGRKR